MSAGARALKYLTALLLASLVIASATFKINDPDTIYYLAHGRYILHHGFSTYSPFVYSAADASVCYPEWLFQVMAYAVYTLARYNGLVIFQILLVALIFLIVLKNSLASKFSFLSTALCMLLAILVGMERFMLRADTFGLLMAVLFYYVLKKAVGPQQALRRYWVALFFIQMLWANTHTSFPLGLVLVLAFLGAEVINPVIEGFQAKKQVAFPTQKIKFLSLAFPACIVASLINPYGVKSFLWPFHFLFSEPVLYSQMEWVSPFAGSDVQQLAVVVYKILFFCSLVVLALNFRRLKLLDLLVLAPYFYLSAKSLRNLGLFALFAALILPFYLDESARQVLNRGKSNPPRKFLPSLQALACAGLIFFIAYFGFRIVTNDLYLRDQRSRRFGFGISELIFPVKAAEFISSNHLAGRLFNDYGIGAYVNWALYPKYQSFIDGHSYTAESLEYYQKIIAGIVPYQDVAKRFGINFFLLNHIFKDTPPLIARLYKDKAWVPVYFDELSIIFIAEKPENKGVIDKFKIDFTTNKHFDPEHLIAITDKIDFSTGWTNRGAFFASVGLLQKAEYAFEQAVRADPENYTALSNLGSMYTQLSKDDRALETYKRAIELKPDFATAHYNLALLYQKTNKLEEAIAEYEEALKINPQIPAAREALENLQQRNLPSLALFQQAGQNDTGIFPQQASGSSSEEANRHFQQAIAFGQKGEHGSAVVEFKKAVDIDPGFTLAHLNLGNAFSMMNMTEDAQKEYERVLELDPSIPLAHLNLGVIYRYQKKDPITALQHWERYIELAPQDPETKNIRIEVESIKKELAHAVSKSGQKDTLH